MSLMLMLSLSLMTTSSEVDFKISNEVSSKKADDHNK